MGWYWFRKKINKVFLECIIFIGIFVTIKFCKKKDMGNQMKQILENFGKVKDEKVKIKSEKKSKRKIKIKKF